MRDVLVSIEIPKDSAKTSWFSVSQKGCHRIFAPIESAPRSNKVGGQLQTIPQSQRFIRHISMWKALRNAL